jgi:hypothetical protein
MSNMYKSRTKTMPSQQRSSFKGHKFQPSVDPPSFNTAPFWSYCVQFEDPFQAGVAYILKPSTVRARILTNLGIVGTAPNLVFRIRSIRIWAVASAQSESVSVTADISSLVPTVSDDVNPSAPRAVYYGIQARLQDSGTLNRPASVGFHYSVLDSTQVISANQSMSIMEYAAGGNGYLRILVNLELSFGGTAAPLGVFSGAPSAPPLAGNQVRVSPLYPSF